MDAAPPPKPPAPAVDVAIEQHRATLRLARSPVASAPGRVARFGDKRWSSRIARTRCGRRSRTTSDRDRALLSATGPGDHGDALPDETMRFSRHSAAADAPRDRARRASAGSSPNTRSRRAQARGLAARDVRRRGRTSTGSGVPSQGSRGRRAGRIRARRIDPDLSHTAQPSDRTCGCRHPRRPDAEDRSRHALSLEPDRDEQREIAEPQVCQRAIRRMRMVCQRAVVRRCAFAVPDQACVVEPQAHERAGLIDAWPASLSSAREIAITAPERRVRDPVPDLPRARPRDHAHSVRGIDDVPDSGSRNKIGVHGPARVGEPGATLAADSTTTATHRAWSARPSPSQREAVEQ